jgi:hypothetical protein
LIVELKSDQELELSANLLEAIADVLDERLAT